MKHAVPKGTKNPRGAGRKRKSSKKKFIISAVLLVLAAAGAFCFAFRFEIYCFFAEPLRCPRELIAYQRAENTVELSWDPVERADGYKILKYRKKQGAYKVISDLPGNVTSRKIIGSAHTKYAVQAYRNVFSGQDLSRDITESDVITVQEQIECIGHRGAMDEAPENTMASFERAYEMGYTAVETDFWETASGELLVMHDRDLSIMCIATGSIRELTADSLKDYPITYGAGINYYDTQYIPTLEQAVKSFSEWKMDLYLHAKYSKMTDEGIEKLIKILDKYNMTEKTTVFSANPEFVLRLCEYDCNAGFLKIPENEADIYDAIDYARENGAETVILRHSPYLSKSLVKIAHGSGLRIGCYNVNDMSTAFSMIDLNADFLITNNCFFKD